MTIKGSGQLTFTEIHDEFSTLGGTYANKPYTLDEYRNLPPGMDLPSSGAIKFSDFYGKSSIRFVAEVDWIAISDTQINGKYNIKECNLWEALQAFGFNDPGGFYDISLPADYWLWSDSTAKGGLIIPSNLTGTIIFRNKGNILGKGGAGGTVGDATANRGKDGGPAVQIDNDHVFNFFNETGAYVAAGGGGGASGGGGAGAGAGGGAGGGLGGTGYREGSGGGGAGGSLNAVGGNGSGGSDSGGGSGGGAGGGGGGWDNGSGKLNKTDSGAGGGGGRQFPGTGGAGGGGSRDTNGRNGGAANAVGDGGGSGHGAGGGGWGARGGNGTTIQGGAGGRAFTTGNSFLNVTNNGTIWGAI